MNSVNDLIEKFGGLTPFSKVIGKGLSTASEMKRTGSIHTRHWQKIIEAAKREGIEGITLESIARLHVHEESAQ